jgi:magnesium chelatase family protein
MAKISGPLLDRIDIQIEVPAVPFRELSARTPGTSSAQMRERVVAARQVQQRRFAGSSTRQNGQMTHRQIRTFCSLDEACMNLLRATMTELGLSARAHDKILRLARTIADLDACEAISPVHISEAINYRTLDRSLWS